MPYRVNLPPPPQVNTPDWTKMIIQWMLAGSGTPDGQTVAGASDSWPSLTSFGSANSAVLGSNRTFGPTTGPYNY